MAARRVKGAKNEDFLDVRLLTPANVAYILHTTPRRVRRMVEAGEIPSVVVGKKSYRIRMRDLEEWMAENMMFKSPSGKIGRFG